MHFPALEIDLKTARCKHYQGETFGIHFCNVKGRIVPEMCSFCSDYSVRAKYNNKKTKSDGIVFDSKKENEKYHELKMLEKSGKIKNLERQKRFELIPTQKDENGKVLYRAITYIADFTYTDCKTGELICEDVKGMVLPEFKLKQKMMYYFYHIKVRII